MIIDERFEKMKVESAEIEMETKKVELAIRQRELRNTGSSKPKISLEKTTIYVAVIGLIGSLVINAIQGLFSEKQRKEEFEFGLITKAVENGDSSISRKNLRFLLDAGLITDKEGKIRRIVIDTSYSLPDFNGARSPSIGDYVFTTPGGSKYHLPTCRLVLNNVVRMPIDQAKESNIRPCKICKPPDIYGIANEVVQCSALSKNGYRCPRMTRIVNGYCFQHQPE